MSTNKDDIDFIAKQSITKDKLPKNVFNAFKNHMCSKTKAKSEESVSKKKIENELAFLSDKVLRLFYNNKNVEYFQSLGLEKTTIEQRISELKSQHKELASTISNTQSIKDLEDYIDSLKDVDCYHINNKLFFFDSNYNKKYCRNITSLSGYLGESKTIYNNYKDDFMIFDEGSASGSGSDSDFSYIDYYIKSNNINLHFFNGYNLGGSFRVNYSDKNAKIFFNVKPLILNSEYNQKAEDFLSDAKYFKTINTILNKCLKIENKINISGSKPEWLENFSFIS